MRNGDSKRSAQVELVARRASKSSSKSASRKPSETREQVESWADRLVRQTREHPGRSVAAAVGVGYVLGGGLFSRLTARLLGTGIRLGLRTAVLPFVTEGLLVLGQKHTTQREDVKNENQ
jgi:hypothetical protein